MATEESMHIYGSDLFLKCTASRRVYFFSFFSFSPPFLYSPHPCTFLYWEHVQFSVRAISALTFLGAWQGEVTSFSQLHGIFSHHENALMFVIRTINKSKKANPSAEQCHMKLN